MKCRFPHQLWGRPDSGFGRYNVERDDLLATWLVTDGEEAYVVLFREDGNVTQNKIDGTVLTVLSGVVVNINFKSCQQKRIGFYLLRNIKDRILSQP